MNYKRLHSRIKGSQKKSFSQMASAFESEGQALTNTFTPLISHPVSDYTEEINEIYKLDTKLGFTFKRLNQHQRHAVFNTAQNTILSAMVGSGKTTVLIAKIFYLHFIKQVAFNQMVVLTFTNKAAREIKERIAAFLGNATENMNEELCYFGTFHAVARQILHEHPNLNKLGFEADFLIMDEQEKQDFLERIIIQENLTIKYQNKLSKRWNNYLATNETKMGNMKSEDDFYALYKIAEREKRAKNAMDFNDLILLCNRLLNEQASLKPNWIIVDEFQDCNEDQLNLIELLRNNNSNLFVVGDQNQSIYGWRGSKERLFQDSQNKWNATWMELPQNYRSSENILSAAQNLLQNNNEALIATRPEGAPIELTRHFNDQQEAFYLKEQLSKFQKQNIPLENTAILFRTHQQIKIVETVLSQANIPHQFVKRNELHENPAQAFLLKILKLCINPNDTDACISLLCDPTFGILKRSKKLIQAMHNKSVNKTAIQFIYDFVKQQNKAYPNYLLLLQQIEKFEQVFLNKTDTTAQQLLDFLALQALLKPTSIHHAQYISSISEAWTQIQLFIKEKGWGNTATFFHIALDQVILEGSFEINDRIKTQGSGVHLLTIHAAKGLEFDRVYIAGANTGIIPLTQHKKSSENLKEEKRLLFVAITRGKNKVEIGWHVQPSTPNTEPEPSYFLNAIPETLLIRKTPESFNAEPQEKPDTEEWTIGMLVKHKKYGTGEITDTNENEIICLFDNLGEKAFSRAFVKAMLTKVE